MLATLISLAENSLVITQKRVVTKDTS